MRLLQVNKSRCTCIGPKVTRNVRCAGSAYCACAAEYASAYTSSVARYTLNCIAIMANFGVKNRGGRGFAADRELSAIYTKLWELDENRLMPGKHYRINLQGGQCTSFMNRPRLNVLVVELDSSHSKTMSTESQMRVHM